MIGPKNRPPDDVLRGFVNMATGFAHANGGDVDITMLGMMLDPGDGDPMHGFSTEPWQAVFGQRGFLRLLAEILPTTIMPAGCDSFLMDARLSPVRDAIKPISVALEQTFTITGQNRDQKLTVTHGWQDAFWLDPLAMPEPKKRVPKWLVRRLVRPLAVPGEVSSEVAACRIRELYEHEAAMDREIGLVHGGPKSYVGRFGELTAGCPGLDYALIVNDETIRTAYLQPL